MKKGNNAPLFMLFAIFITFLLALAWVQARNESQRIADYLNDISTIRSDDYNLQIQLQDSIFESDTDTLNYYNQVLLEDIFRLKQNIGRFTDHQDFEFVLIDSILSAQEVRQELIEDFKTHNAIINNSLNWLRYLGQNGQLHEKDLSLLHHLKDYYYGYIPIDKKSNFDLSSNGMIKRHMELLNDQIGEFQQIRLALDHTRSDGLLQRLNDHFQKKFDELDMRRFVLMWMFMGGIILSFGMVLYFYWKERQSASRLLKTANELEQVFDALSSTNIVSKTDLMGQITYVNDAFCLASGYSREDLVGKSHNIVRHQKTPKEVFTHLWSTIQDGKVFQMIIQNRTKSGDDYYVDSTIIPIRDETGDIFEYMAIRNDVTALIKARDEAIMAEQFKDRFLSNMSHELRTPLNGIIGFAHLLKEKSSDPTSKKYLNIILESSHNLLSIINNILDLFKIKSGKFSLDEHPFSPYESLSKLLEPFSIEGQAKSIDVSYSIDVPKTLTLNGDSVKISQIITNLLSNALKFTSKGGKVSFKASYHDGLLECKVADSGIGMDEQTIERIFQPFIQADISTTRAFGGTGLGLSITKELVELMKGEINVYSKPGVGSRFTVTMAIAPEIKNTGNAEEPPLSAQKFPQLSGHILIAEDDSTNCLLISSLLEAFGLSHECAEDGEEVVELFQKSSFDLILMDENMPQQSGVEAMKQIRKLPGGTLPIVALTANVMEGDKERFLKEGMDDFIGKPIMYTDLERTLLSYLSPKN